MKKIIARISEGLGNQLFMYANAYALSKKLKYDLYIDNVTAYKKLKIRSYLLDRFNIKAELANDKDIQSSYQKYLIHKFNKKIDFFRKKKFFLIENKSKYKITEFEDYSNISFADKIYVEGYFESEKYFKDYKNEIINQLAIKKLNTSSFFLDPSKIINQNSVSIAIRKDRFSEKKSDKFSLDKSEYFEKRTIDYIFKSIDFINSKISNPKFFIFSDNIKGLNSLFDQYKNCTVINHSDDKIINDFYLSSLCKHFIVGPSTFHWWTAYLSKNEDKICICPPNDLKFSSNKNIYPEKWLKLNL
ncbi:hypothetical protein CBE37_00010 [bacterium TMED277]|nr:MAG: hypothetical protein CBE37_00010 [bacterium TMED277]|tara:strand:- start:177 stop:1082 length:906 start_codon:yes stop_codon:yes gene_type:complete